MDIEKRIDNLKKTVDETKKTGERKLLIPIILIEDILNHLESLR